MATAEACASLDARLIEPGDLPIAVPTVRQWLDVWARLLWERRGCPDGDPLTDWVQAERQYELRVAEEQDDNLEWFDRNASRLLAEHPEWQGKCLAIASRAKGEVLAVAEDCAAAIGEAMESGELKQLASSNQFPPGAFLTAVFLTDLDG